MSEVTSGLQSFFEGWELYSDGVLAGVVLGVVLGFLGVYIVLRRLVFMSAALSQASSLGVVVALTLGATLSGEREVTAPVIGALLFGFGAALWVSRASRRPSVQRDGLLGAIYLVGASGTLLLGSRMAHEMHEIEALLHGVGVAVMPEDLELVLWIGSMVLVVHALGWRAVAAVAFDPIGAAVRRIPVTFVDLVMALSLAAAFAAGIRALGALPVFALSVVPAIAAIRFALTLPRALAFAALIGALSAYHGYALAFVLDAPVGASQTIMALAITGALLVARVIGRSLPGKKNADAMNVGLLRATTGGLLVLAVAAMLSVGRPDMIQVVGVATISGLAVAALAGLGQRLFLLGLAGLAAVWSAAAPTDPGLVELVRGLLFAWLIVVAIEHIRRSSGHGPAKA